MIELYTSPTPNGWKASIALEELELPYTVHADRAAEARAERGLVSEDQSERTHPDHRRQGQRRLRRVRVRRDPDLPGGEDRPADAQRFEGPLAGHPVADVPDGRHRSDDGTGERLLPLRAGEDSVRHRPLSARMPAPVRGARQAARCAEYLAGDYSIADIATWSWVHTYAWSGVEIDGLDHLKRWLDAIGARPAVQRGRAGAADPAQTCQRRREPRRERAQDPGVIGGSAFVAPARAALLVGMTSTPVYAHRRARRRCA